MHSPFRAFILDDEPHSIQSLKWEAQPLSDLVTFIGESSQPMEAQSLVAELKPDLLFLDIEMPGLNGFEFLERMGPVEFEVIFTTAYEAFAVQAFAIDAADYLLKPVSENALRKSLEKLEQRRNKAASSIPLESILHHLTKALPALSKIALPTLHGLLFIRTDDITHCCSESNYTHIFTCRGDKILVSKSLKEIEEMIPHPRFLRVHHSHLVNLLYIREYHKGKGGSLILEDGTIVPVSKQRKKDLLDHF